MSPDTPRPLYNKAKELLLLPLEEAGAEVTGLNKSCAYFNSKDPLEWKERETGIEPATSSLGNWP